MQATGHAATRTPTSKAPSPPSRLRRSAQVGARISHVSWRHRTRGHDGTGAGDRAPTDLRRGPELSHCCASPCQGTSAPIVLGAAHNRHPDGGPIEGIDGDSRAREAKGVQARGLVSIYEEH